MKPQKISLLFLVCLFGVAHLEAKEEVNQHAETWNTCVNNIYALHQRLIVEDEVRVEKSKGGYANLREWFYIEEKYFDKKTGHLISQIQWDGLIEGQLHTIEVYVRDDDGRVIRDYVAAYLPHYHNAPTQTLITLHRYNKKLHAFRSFDASGYRVVERCQGKYKGKRVEILLDEDEIAELQYEESSVMQSDAYKACFGDLQTEVGIYQVAQ